MSFYQEFTVVRQIEPDPDSLFNTLRIADSTVGIQHSIGTNKWILKKSTAWTGPQINFAQNAIANAPNLTDQLSAQGQIDKLPIIMRALVLTLIDEINILRSAAGLAPRTPVQAIQAIRDKAGTL